MMRSAVVQKLAIIGEAAARLSEPLKGTAIAARPRTDPYVQSYRIRLLPKVGANKRTLLRIRMQHRARRDVLTGQGLKRDQLSRRP